MKRVHKVEYYQNTIKRLREKIKELEKKQKELKRLLRLKIGD